ncbi:unnamed protein product [Dicrocoelium dendriticum]|nr:unnamed protein product [Dicrocoelium dendriticum]
MVCQTWSKGARHHNRVHVFHLWDYGNDLSVHWLYYRWSTVNTNRYMRCDPRGAVLLHHGTPTAKDCCVQRKSISTPTNHILCPVSHFFSIYLTSMSTPSAAILPLGMCFGVSTIFAALALVGSCVFNVWRFIRDRRAKKAHSEGGGGGVLIGSGSPATISTEPGYPQPSQGVGADASAFHGQQYEKAAVEAVRGVVAGGTGAGYRGAY